MSFSNDYIDKSPHTIVPEFRDATQISEQDALRIQVSALKHDLDRTACERRIQRAEDYPILAQKFLKDDENAFVQANLKPELLHSLTYGPDDRSHDQVERDLRHRFHEMDTTRLRKEQITQTEERLWSDVRDRLADAQERERAPEPTKAAFLSKREAQFLSRTFTRSVER